MVKGWADHCSSDEEEEDEPAVVMVPSSAAEESAAQAETEPEPKPEEQEEAATPEPSPEAPPARKERVYEYPTEPPFMAYVGNLAYSLTDPRDLAAEVQALASEKLSASINVLHARVMKDRQNNDRPRGFGYVEVETLEMLKQLMELNTTGDPLIAGRRVTFDVSNYTNQRRSSSHRNHNGNRRSSETSIDGTKFRGGRYASNNPRGGGGGAPATEESASATTTTRDPAAQRPSLKLKPRTKPVEDEDLSGSQSDIFGGAKARDETTWKERRISETKQASTAAGSDGGDSATGDQKQHRRDSSHNKGRGGRGRGEGGRGRGGEGGRGRGRGEGGRGGETNRGRNERGSFREKKKSEKPHAPAPAPKPAPPPEPEKAPPKKPTVTNAFAALAMDSDSD